jgi:ethanolamine ammonia-lyase small subunit
MIPRDAWADLRRFTAARIGLGRAGHAVPTREIVEFGIAHAGARDAVWTAWDVEGAAGRIPGARIVRSNAPDRPTYLRRPDLGRTLRDADRAALAASASAWDVAFIVTNGLSSTAVERNAAELVAALQERLGALRLAPVVLVPDGRVAVGDDVAHALGARCAVVIVGERPGLSSADSLGIYLTFDPKPGTTDERRNCISNVRPDGFPLAAAAHKAGWLVEQALIRQLSGVALKDEAPALTPGPRPPPP